MTKIFECAICKRLSEQKIKGEKRFTGTRKDVREHLVERHGIKGQKNWTGEDKKDFISNITQNMIATEI